MQDEPGIPRRCSIFPGRAPHPPRPSRRWGAGAALVVLAAVLGIATPEDAQAQLSAPLQFSVRIAAAQATLTWAVPTNDGGATITKYQYRYSAGNTVDTSDTTATWTDVPDGADADTDAGNETTVTVTGLTGTEYTFEVRAVNSVGEGPAATKTVRAPSAPQQFSVRIAADNGEQATLTWDAPQYVGTTNITRYQYRYSAGNTVDTSDTTATWTDVPDGADADTDAGNETTVTVTGLTGTEYTFEVRAVNSVGEGPAATKTVRAPSAPQQFSVRIAADNGEQATLTWDAPQYVGTTNITRYQYRYSAGNTVDTSATWTDVPDGADDGAHASDERTVTVTGLTTGTVYAFELRAVSGAGPGPVVRQTVTAPDEPQQFSVMIAAAQATLTWAVPTNDGGATITKYQYRYSAGSTVDTSVAWSDVPDGADPDTDAGNETTVTVTGLTGTVHAFEVRAVNSVGAGSVAMQTVTVPSEPRQFSVRIAADDGTQATLTWAVPTNAGGAPITKYQYRYSAGSMIDTSADWTDVPDGVDAGTDAGNETTVTVTGLITRPPHTFQVRAVNSVGPGDEATKTVTVPSKPLQFSVRITADDGGQATLTWDAPMFVGTTNITRYQYRYSVGDPDDTSAMWSDWTDVPDGADDGAHASDERTVTVTGLTTGTDTFQVRAVNDGGGGPAAKQTVTAPDVPRQFSVMIAAAQATLTWAVPTNDGGATITKYQYRYSAGSTVDTSVAWSDVPDGADTGTDAGNETTVTVTGLTGTVHAFEVRAVNSVGPGPAATQTVTVTAPSEPRQFSVMIAAAQATLTWAVPTNDGGTTITKYEYRYSAGSTVDTSAAWSDVPDGADADTDAGNETTVTVTGLTGTVHTFQVRAVNSVGAGDAATQTVTVPSEPRRFLIFPDADDREAGLQWSVPTSDGGAPITAYEYRYAVGTTVPASTMWTSQTQTPPDDTDAIAMMVPIPSKLRTAVVTGLTTNTQYTFEVRARNSAGPGPPALPVTATVPRALIELSWDQREAWLGPSFTLTITFSEAVTGFELNDLSITTYSMAGGNGIQSSGDIEDFRTISAGTTYSVEVTPTPPGSQRALSVVVIIPRNAVLRTSDSSPNKEKEQLIDLILPVTGTEIEALTALYNATDGANWTDSTNWLDATKPLGEWHGVTTNTDGEVIELDLRNNELSGSLPVALGNLRNLTQLYLHRNALSGPIPPDLGLFENLEHLHLHRNALSGAIPERLGGLSLLEQLYLQGNELSGPIPPEFRLSSLVDLKLHSNAALSGPLPAISPTALPNLKELGMQNTALTIPENTDLTTAQTQAFAAWGARITDGTQTSDGVITLDADNTRPTGLWADSTTLYVVGEDGGKVYAYTLPSGVRAPAKDITLHADNAHPTGLWSDGTTLWVLDYEDGKIYAYTLADGMRDAAKDIESVLAGYGLWGRKDATCTGSDAPCLLWVARAGQLPIRLMAYRIYADTSASVTYGSANTGFDKALPTSDLIDIESDVSGFWWEDPEPDGDPPTVWISDRFDAALYAYSANPRMAGESSSDIVSAAMQNRILEPDNLSPTAFWSDGTMWWVADLYAGKVFVYGLSAPPPVIMQDPLGMPQSFSAMPGDTQEVVLSWTAPASDGGEAITKYQYRYSAGSTVDTSATTATWTDVPDGADADTDTSDETTFTVTGLTNGMQYAFQVRAWNSGAGPPTTTDTATPTGPSTDATLSALVLSNGSPITLDPSFASGTTSYTASVASGVDEITITPTVNESNATVQYQDSSDMDITDADATPENGHQVSLDVGENTIKVKVTAEDGTTTETYTVTVTRAEPDSTDATLSALALSSNGSDITLDPSFASDIMSYTASVPNGVDEITITPTVNESNATVQYQDSSDMDITDADDTPENGHQVPLDVVGENTIKVKVTAEDRTTTETYTVTVTRLSPSADATLSALGLSSNGFLITLSPSFASGTTSYTASVVNGVDEITITPTVNESNATVEYQDSSDMDITDADDTPENGHQVPLDVVGENTIKVKVTAADNITTETYTVTVTRAEPDSTDATLSALALSSNGSPITLTPAFASDIMSYTASSVAYRVAQITIAPTRTDIGASVAYFDSSDTEILDADADAMNGQQVSLAVGPNTIKVKVTAVDSTMLTYTVTVTRLSPSADATLSALALSNGSDITLDPSFASGTTSYTASVVNGVDEITITPTVNESNATVQYQDSSDMDITDADDTPENGHQVPLNVVGENTIKVKVTAEDGTTTETYTVTVTRAEPDSTDATLSALALSNASNDSPIALTPTFASSTTSYTASVVNGVDEITITPTVNESNATVQYQDSSDMDITDADDAKSGHQVPLDVVGENTIKVKVTAEDGTTTETYTVTVTRAEPDSADATLSALGLSSNGFLITLDPSFASGTTSYTASVVNGVDEITITPTVNESNATVQYQDSSNMDITDADDTPENGHQVPLDVVGENTIKVKVTAADNITTETYTVTVTRAEPDSTDATLSALVLSSDDSTIELSPPFASGTMSYTASSVAYRVAQITIAPTRTDIGASVAYFDDSDTEILDADMTKDGQQVPLAVGPNTIKVKVTSADSTMMLTYTVMVTRSARATGTTTSGGTGGGGGGGGGGSSQDDHGNTPAQATPVTLDPTRTASVRGQINTAPDVDYFSAAVPHAGVLVVETSGPTATVGTVWQAGAELATAARGGVGQNFRLRVRVAPGSVVIALQGQGGATGAYTLQVTFLSGHLENPGAASFQSGIGVISGWTCDAEAVEIVLNGVPQEAAYGTARLDTEAMCGDSDNGFGLLFNWNLLRDGEHEVVALVDGVELDRATVMVTTLGTEFLRDVTGTCTAADFPTMDETVTLAWQQTQQNFVIVDGMPPTGENRTGRAGVGYLENPGPNSFQSGIGVLSGWVCEGEEVVIELNGAPQPAAYGTERLDTLAACGDTANGFGLLFNWNLLGEGEHEVVAFVDGEELGRATVRVTTLGAEFVRGAEGECTVEDFPMLGETVTLEWQQNSQNFVVTDVE